MTIQTLEAMSQQLDADLAELADRFGPDELAHLDTSATRPTTPLGDLQARIEGAMRVLGLSPRQARERYAENLKKNSNAS